MNHQTSNKLTRRSFLGAAAAGATATVGVGAEKPRPECLDYRCQAAVVGAYDVVVCGAGPSGVAAALAARRAGLAVLLVEGQGQLGGMGISALVSHWLGGRTSDCKQWVVGGINGTDGASVSEGMIRGRAEAQQLFTVMQQHFPGFAQARLKTVAPLLGVRETRRIRGVATLGLEAVAQGKKFDDVIGFSAYGWDLPDPKRPSDNPGHGRKPPVVPIPYRTLVPRGVTNLICPGRALSVERPVLGPLRVMAPCMAMGEAAGLAALQAVGEGRSFAEVDPVRLRRELAENNAVVEWT